MPSNQFSKQPQQLSSAFGNYLNGGHGDSVVGGALSGVPSAIGATQGIQDIPGDRIVIGMADALALSKTSVGTLYGGVYQYVTLLTTSTLAAVIGACAFWVTAPATAPNDSYTVTADETQAEGANYKAGVFINIITKGYSAYICIAGMVNALFTNPLTGTGAAGAAAFVAGDGAGGFDTFDGVGANPTFDQVQTMFNRYAGVLHAAAANATKSVIQMPLSNVRW